VQKESDSSENAAPPYYPIFGRGGRILYEPLGTVGAMHLHLFPNEK